MSGFIPEEKIEEIRATSDIFEVISGYITLNRSGKNYKGLCPFHHEKTPSFIVSSEKQMFHCFGCGQGGNVFSLLMKYENLSFPEAVLSVAKRYGIQIKLTRDDKSEKFVGKKEILYGVNSLANEFFKKTLKETSEGKAALEYLRKRGIEEGSFKDFNIGYALSEWDSLVKYLGRKGYSEEIILESGLAVQRENKSGSYDRFRKRIIFPIFHINGEIIGFGGRNLDDSLPKYINSPETLIYKKGESLYGLHIAKERIKTDNCCIVMEGYVDVVTAHRFGFKNSLASLGTALTEKQLRLIKSLTGNIIFIYDADRAGINAVLRAWEGVLKTGLCGKVVVLPEGDDPDSFLNSKGTEDFKALINSSKDIGEYIIDRSVEGYNLSTTSDRSQALTKVLKVLESVMCILRLADYANYLVSKLGVKEEFLYEAIKYDRKKDITFVPLKEETRKIQLDSLEVHLIQLMLTSKEVATRVFDNISSDDFEVPLLKKIAIEIANSIKSNKEFEPNRIMNIMADEEVNDLISAFLFKSEDWQDIEKAISDCIKQMQKRKAKKTLNNIEDELKLAKGKGDENTLDKLLEQKYKLYTFLKSTKFLEN